MSKALSRAAWGLALAVLAAALIFFNLPSSDKPENAALSSTPSESDLPSGHEPGQRLPDFTITLTDGSEFSLSAQRGRVTVINLWATWCTPCVNELPHFDRLLAAHPGEVTILAIHSDLITDDVQEYLSVYDYAISFAIDEGGEVIRSMGGSTMLPQTLVLDPRGVVTYNKVGSITYEALESLCTAAAQTD